ncbi:MAG TPA: pilus assembly protein TadG-related protein, partial [Hyphomicrobiaceae bacterium]|nr:pilus assembly protein TadG-related protein [Hyphomicrobiaceae bacterium]
MRIWSRCRPTKLSPTLRVNDFATDVAGVTSVLFALCFAVVFAAAAIAVDWGRGVLEKQRQQTAL